MKIIQKLTVFLTAFIISVSFMSVTSITVSAESADGVTQLSATVHSGGIALHDNFEGGVKFELNKDAEVLTDNKDTYGSTLVQPMSVKLPEKVNATASTEWTGFLINIKNTSSSDLKFSTYLLSNDIVGRTFVGSTVRYDTFITEQGENLADSGEGIYTRSGYLTLSGGVEGTWNYKFSELAVGRASMTSVDEILFFIRISDATQLGRGIIISSIALYKDNGDGTCSSKTLFNFEDCSVSYDAQDTEADINIAAPESGKIVNLNRPVYNNTGVPVADEYSEDLHTSAMGMLSFETQKITPVHYSESADGLYAEGRIDESIGLKNNASAVTIPAGSYGSAIHLAVRFRFFENINATAGSEWEGLLIKMSNEGTGQFGFYAYLYNGSYYDDNNDVYGKLARSYISSTNRQEVFIDGDGNDLGKNGDGILTASARHTIDPGAEGTLNYKFDNLLSGRAYMTDADSFIVGIRTDSYKGQGVNISSISAYKTDPSSDTGYITKTLFNAKDLVVGGDAEDLSCDLNTGNYDNGKIVNTKLGIMNNADTFISNTYPEVQTQYHDQSLDNVTISYSDRFVEPFTIGASIRLSQDGSMRFISEFSKTYFESLDCDSYKIGTLLKGGEYSDEDLTVDTENSVKIYNGDVYWQETEKAYIISAYIYGITPDRYSTKVSARAFIELNKDGEISYIYGDVILRSYEDVAKSALADDSTEYSDKYCYEAGDGIYSPYTAEERELLESFIA